MSLEDESLAWRRQVLEEATRLRGALKEAQKRREAARQEALKEEQEISESPSFNNDEMEKFEEAQRTLQKNTSRLIELRKQVESNSISKEAEEAHLSKLEMAQQAMEATNKRMLELEKEFLEEHEDEEEALTDQPAVATKSGDDPSADAGDAGDDAAGDDAAGDDAAGDDAAGDDAAGDDAAGDDAAGDDAAGDDAAADGDADKGDGKPEKKRVTVVEPKRPVVPRLHHTDSMMARAEDTWSRMAQENNTSRTSRPLMTPHGGVKSTPIPSPADGEGDKFLKPKNKREEVTFDVIRKEMNLTSSPLVFFNLACFQGSGDAELDVMHPICGYAVAGKLLAVMGPPGTDTSTLRIALSDFPKETATANQRDVLVADFTVRDLIEVSDGVLRPASLAPGSSLIEHLGLDGVGDVQIGTCIQRGSADSRGTLGTPRGARYPEAPTPRNPETPRFRGSQAAIQKSVLLMEDLMSVLDSESIFRVLKCLHKVAVAKRASVIITLNKPFERRGLFSLFDDLLYFSEEGVSYFGPVRRLKDYCGLIGSPCPPGLHVTDHIHVVSNAAAKYDECLIKKGVDDVILEYTGTREQPDATPRGSLKPQKQSKPLLPGFRKRNKKNKPEQLPEQFENLSPGMSSRARRLAMKLAEERRQLALKQRADEKLQVWNKLAELDLHIARGSGGAPEPDAQNFEQMLLDLQQDAKKQRPSCFMNLACFMNIENPPDKMVASVIQPTCAFANEGSVMGIMGPPGSDAGNLLASLKFGSETTTTVTDVSVRDTLKLSEFLKNREKSDPAAGLDSSVEILMAKMMLSASSQEVVGTLIQRGNDRVAPNTQIEIGDKVMSTAVRSILLLDRIHVLDAQSLFVVLKLIKRIAVPARLAIIFLLSSPEECEGLYPLLDNVLIFSEEGVGYFGPSKHLASYCNLVGFPKPEGVHVTNHFRKTMYDYAPSKYVVNEANLETPFTVRWNHSALAKYSKGIIDISTKPQSEGGNMSSRTLLPKSFRKKTARVDTEEAVMERAEMSRQRVHRQRLMEAHQEERQREKDASYEEVWTRLAESDAKNSKPVSLATELESIVVEMNTGQQRPSLFFNLACFLPNITTDRIDMMQPICGYALIGRVVAIMGPSQTDLSAFLGALSGGEPPSVRDGAKSETGHMGPPPSMTLRTDVLHKVLTVLELLKIAESSRPDRGSQSLAESANALLKNLGLEDQAAVRIGTFIQRGLSVSDIGQAEGSEEIAKVPSILMLDHFSEGLNPQAAFVVLKLVKRIAAQAQMAVIVHLTKDVERRGLFPLLDDALVFDKTGVAYFGPANRLRDYLTLVGYPCPKDVHETDHTFNLMQEYESQRRSVTDTSPTIRYRYSPLAKYVQTVVDRYTKPASNDYDLKSSRETQRGGASDSQTARDLESPAGVKRGTTFIPKGTRNTFSRRLNRAKSEDRKRMEEEEGALRRARIAEQEAEAERHRQAEADAEAVWKKMMEQG